VIPSCRRDRGVIEAAEKAVVLGKVSGLFGVKGWIKVYSYTDPRAGILDYRDWWLCVDGEWRRFELAEGQPHGKTIIARLDGIDDRESAALLVDAQIGVSRDALPEIEDGHYYWSDLEGLKVENREGRALGTVVRLVETGANDVMVVSRDGQETLVPFVTGEVIKSVDLAKGIISVDWEWD